MVVGVFYPVANALQNNFVMTTNNAEAFLARQPARVLRINAVLFQMAVEDCSTAPFVRRA